MAILSNHETEEGFFSVSTMAPQHPTTGKSSSIGNTSLVNWSSFRSTSSSTLEDHHRHNSSSSITTTSSLGSSLSSLFREGFRALAFLRDSDTERHFFEGVQHVKQNNTTKQQPKDKNSRGSMSTSVHNGHNTTKGYEDADDNHDHDDSEHEEEDERDQEEIVCMRVTRSARTRHRSLLLNNDSRGLMNYDGDYGDDNTGDEGDDEDDHDDMLVNHKEEETAFLRRRFSNASSSVTASTARSGGRSSSFRSQSKQLIKTDSDKAMRL